MTRHRRRLKILSESSLQHPDSTKDRSKRLEFDDTIWRQLVHFIPRGLNINNNMRLNISSMANRTFRL